MSISLAAEFIVSGLIPFLAILFFILSIFHIRDLSFLSEAKDFAILLALFAALSMYLLGALLHRLNDLLSTRCVESLLRILPTQLRRFPRRIVQFVLKQPQPKNVEGEEEEWKSTDVQEWAEWVVLILQSGSDRLNDDILNDWSLLRVFKSTALTAPMLAGSLSWWLSQRAVRGGVRVASSVCALLTAAAVVSFLVQRRRHWRKVQIAVEMMRE